MIWNKIPISLQIGSRSNCMKWILISVICLWWVINLSKFNLIWESDSAKLLGKTIDNHLKFDKHISLLCAKANRKLSALNRIFYFLTFSQKRTLIKAFFESQFNYCSLTWMFHRRKSNNNINLLHERALSMTYNRQISSYPELLDKDNSFTVHHFNIHSLAIEIFKVINNISATIIDNLFTTYHS